MYIFNTLQEVTRRAAAQASSTDFTNGAAMQKVREGAVFRTAPGTLMFADPVTDAHVRIDYLAITNDGAGLKTAPVHTLPTSPDDNYQICMTDPHDAGCIRMVRVRICQPGTGEACEAVPYRPMLTLVPFPLTLPPSTTIVVAETLGRPAGLPPALSAPLSE